MPNRKWGCELFEHTLEKKVTSEKRRNKSIAVKVKFFVFLSGSKYHLFLFSEK